MILYPLIRSYVDDVIGCHQHEHVAWQQFDNTAIKLRELSTDAKIKKDKPPAQRQEILAAEIDSVLQRVFLPARKYKIYSNDIDEVSKSKKMSKLRLLSITGPARHSAQFATPLAVMARGMEQYAYSVAQLHHNINVTNQMRADLAFLKEGLHYAATIGIPFQYILKPADSADIIGYTDAAKVHGGIGGYLHFEGGGWFQCHWNDINLHRPENRPVRQRGHRQRRSPGALGEPGGEGVGPVPGPARGRPGAGAGRRLLRHGAPE